MSSARPDPRSGDERRRRTLALTLIWSATVASVAGAGVATVWRAWPVWQEITRAKARIQALAAAAPPVTSHQQSAAVRAAQATRTAAASAAAAMLSTDLDTALFKTIEQTAGHGATLLELRYENAGSSVSLEYELDDWHRAAEITTRLNAKASMRWELESITRGANTAAASPSVRGLWRVTAR